jgi:hypothetical protein
MTFRRVLTATLVAASALVIAPTAIADQADARQDVIMIESVTRPGDVWDQSNWSGYPVIAYPNHGEANQMWEVLGNGTILREERDGLCATAENDQVVGRPCTGYADQRWFGLDQDDATMIRLYATGLCVTHDGSKRQLLLRDCDPDRSDQRWYIRG